MPGTPNYNFEVYNGWDYRNEKGVLNVRNYHTIAQWTHYAVTFDGAPAGSSRKITAYINGELVSSGPDSYLTNSTYGELCSDELIF